MGLAYLEDTRMFSYETIAKIVDILPAPAALYITLFGFEDAAIVEQVKRTLGRDIIVDKHSDLTFIASNPGKELVKKIYEKSINKNHNGPRFKKCEWQITRRGGNQVMQDLDLITVTPYKVDISRTYIHKPQTSRLISLMDKLGVEFNVGVRIF